MLMATSAVRCALRSVAGRRGKERHSTDTICKYVCLELPILLQGCNTNSKTAECWGGCKGRKERSSHKKTTCSVGFYSPSRCVCKPACALASPCVRTLPSLLVGSGSKEQAAGALSAPGAQALLPAPALCCAAASLAAPPRRPGSAGALIAAAP